MNMTLVKTDQARHWIGEQILDTKDENVRLYLENVDKHKNDPAYYEINVYKDMFSILVERGFYAFIQNTFDKEYYHLFEYAGTKGNELQYWIHPAHTEIQDAKFQADLLIFQKFYSHYQRVSE